MFLLRFLSLLLKSLDFVGNSDPSKGDISELSLLFLLHVMEFSLEHLSASLWVLTASPKYFSLAGNSTPLLPKAEDWDRGGWDGTSHQGREVENP